MRYIALFIIATSFALLQAFTVRAEEGVHHSNFYNFEDFPAEIGKVKKAPLQLAKGTKNWTFRTRIREAYQGEPNFAGHYIVAQWGCGTECQVGVIIDTKTGRIYDGYVSGLGVVFRADSTLLVMDPLWDEYWQHPEWARGGMVTQYFSWNGKKFVLLREEPWATMLPDQQETGSVN